MKNEKRTGCELLTTLVLGVKFGSSPPLPIGRVELASFTTTVGLDGSSTAIKLGIMVAMETIKGQDLIRDLVRI